MMGYGDGGWGGWLAMILTMLVFWGGLAAFVYWVVRGMHAPSAAGVDHRPTAPAEAILAERFARGEIDADEYRNRRELLG